MASRLNKQVSTEEIKNATNTRGTLYRFLSRGFSLEVNGDYLEWVLLLQPIIEKLAIQLDNNDFKKGSDRLRDFAKQTRLNYEKDKTGFLQILAAEYASLFLNVGLKPVHPVESVFLGKGHLLYEEPYFDIMRIYQLYGFKKTESFREPEDHIAVELEFMSHLCNLTVRSLEEEKNDYGAGYLENQVEFLRLHLKQWVPDFVEKIKWASSNDFYLALADILLGLVSTDGQVAGEFARKLRR